MRARLATADDADACAAVLQAVAEEERWIATEPPVDVAERAERFRAMLAAGDVLFVLEDDDGRIVGNLALHHSRARGVMSLGMAIVAGARGRGGGRALMDAALDWLADSDAHKVELEVWPDNVRAIALYERYGFEVEGLRRDHYRRRDGSLRSSLIMARLLRAQSRPGAGT
ncbi:MAG TPA: GNAT family N-acetyltransferase [Solirubrobacteraceae bacterium]|nr:GNAT family N-acetyltransferase [Solirubrobacteraceae bacterium]